MCVYQATMSNRTTMLLKQNYKENSSPREGIVYIILQNFVCVYITIIIISMYKFLYFNRTVEGYTASLKKNTTQHHPIKSVRTLISYHYIMQNCQSSTAEARKKPLHHQITVSKSTPANQTEITHGHKLSKTNQHGKTENNLI